MYLITRDTFRSSTDDANDEFEIEIEVGREIEHQERESILAIFFLDSLSTSKTARQFSQTSVWSEIW